MLAGACLAGRLFENSSECLDQRALLMVLIGIVTIVEVNFVGDTTIYSLKVANIREELHDSITWLLELDYNLIISDR